MKNQHIEINGVYNPNRAGNLANPLLVGNINRDTPDYSQAIIASGLADSLDSVNDAVVAIGQYRKQLDEKVQRTANEKRLQRI